MKNKKTLVLKNNRQTLIRSLIIIGILGFVALFIFGASSTVFATNIENSQALRSTMQSVINIVSTAAKYSGIVIALWGIVQIILALRREDSEGISKQIMTVVVGAGLIAIGASLPTIYRNLGGQ
jgi:uncharacterized membrane protein HdeD (DUF308 family)